MTHNPYCWTCNKCGANLDHGENCDCDKTTDQDVMLKFKKDEKGPITVSGFCGPGALILTSEKVPEYESPCTDI